MPQRETKEWTLMFYFASDNPLAPSIIPQLKSIKQAGYHPQVNVITQFDPQPEGTPTHIFDVNLVNKLKGQKSDLTPPRPGEEHKPRRTGKQIGYSGLGPNDPFVSNLIEDKLWRHEKGSKLATRDSAPGKDDEKDDQKDDEKAIEIRERLKASLLAKFGIDYDPPLAPPFMKPAPPQPGVATNGETLCDSQQSDDDKTKEERVEVELNPKESLCTFVKFCAEFYPARHYILFILGHGVVVANDIFLFDEHADAHSLSLNALGDILDGFNQKLAESVPEGKLELVSFHSCSVSSFEVAYQLKDKVNYMLGSQGPAFVGSWPYRQILMRLFKNADKLAEPADEQTIKSEINEAFRDITAYCFHNNKDFLLAGYSFDVSLCDLTKVTHDISKAIRDLKESLIAGLRDELVKRLILLAHLEAQSEWQESYTDLHDFCLCLRQQFTMLNQALGAAAENLAGETLKKLGDLDTTCKTLTGLLAGSGTRPIVKNAFVGPEHQYSHGLSVYFPWVRPVADRRILKEYGQYKFNKETQWCDFLTEYFDQTQRLSRKAEGNDELQANGNGGSRSARQPSPDDELNDELANLVFAGESRLRGNTSLDKTNPRDKTGDSCDCAIIKNYPRDIRDLRHRLRMAAKPDEQGGSYVPLSQGASFASEP